MTNISAAETNFLLIRNFFRFRFAFRQLFCIFVRDNPILI